MDFADYKNFRIQSALSKTVVELQDFFSTPRHEVHKGKINPVLLRVLCDFVVPILVFRKTAGEAGNGEALRPQPVAATPTGGPVAAAQVKREEIEPRISRIFAD